jgi:hypothetical protein
MSVSLETRKPVQLLTLNDLESFPIWEYDDEEEIVGRDETWVRPVNSQWIPRGSYTLVAADFRASCGREYEGTVSVSRLEDPAVIFNSVIYHRDNSFLLPDPENVFFDRAMADLLSGLRLSESEFFPLVYTLRVPFDDEQKCRNGTIISKS